MTEETQVAEPSVVPPVAGTENQATEAPETQEVAAEVEVEKAESEEDDASKALKRMQRRIDKRTADVYRTRAENEQLKARLQELQASSNLESEPRQADDPRVLAREIASIERFTERANSIVSEGTKTHTDYMQALQELSREVGDFVKPNGAPSAFMEVVLEVVDKPSDVLYHLGKNPDLAEELAELSPLKLAKRLDRIERELADKSKPKPSSAPKPLEPVKPKASDGGLSSSLPIDEWMKRREQEIKAKRGY